MCAIRLLTSLKLCAIIFHSSFRINCLQTGDKDDWLAQHLPGILSRGCRRLWYWLAHAEWATDYQILCINLGHSNYPCWGDLKWISSGGQGVVKLWAMPIIFDMFPSQGFEIWLDWMINKCPFHELYWSQSAFFRTDYHPIHFYKKVFLFVLDNQCVGILPVYSTELLCAKFESFTFEGKAGRGWGACAGETWIGEIKSGLKTEMVTWWYGRAEPGEWAGWGAGG